MFEELITAPTSEPVTIEEAATFCRIDVPTASPPDAEYLQLMRFISVARAMVENKTGQALLTQSWRLTLDSFPAVRSAHNQWQDNLQYVPTESIQLYRTPVDADSLVITYIDSSNEEQTFSSDNYTVANGRISLKAGKCWPTTACERNAVTIEYDAGRESAADVPDDLKVAIMFLVNHWNENRDMIGKEPTMEVARSFSSLCAAFINITFPTARQ